MNHTTQPQWEHSPSQVRCRIPRQSNPAAAIAGTLLILFGSAIGFWPILTSLMFAGVGPAEQEAPLKLILLPLVFFGIFCFPIAGFLMIKGTLILAGRVEIILEGDRLSAVTRCGPVWRTQRCALQDLAGFRVENDLGGESASDLTAGRSSLVAVRRQGRPIHLLRMYPEDMVDDLADDLAKQCESFASRQGIPWQGRANPDEVSLDPRQIEKRSVAPIGSNAIVEQNPQGCVITLPAKGWRRKSQNSVRIWCYAWVGCTSIFTAVFLPALIMGNVQGQPAAGWVMLTIVWMVNVAIIVLLLNAAVRRGKIIVAEGQLRFEEVELFETHRDEWNRGVIENIVVGAHEHKSDDSTRWENYIAVCPERKEKSRRWFGNRDKPELEWIASLLHDALDLDADWRSRA